jgi:hypothetical protein
MTTPTTTPGLRRPPLPRPTRLPTGPTAARAAAAALLAALAACGDARSPTAAQAAVNTGMELHTFTVQNCTPRAGVGASRQVAAASFGRDRDRGGVSPDAAGREVPSARWSSAWWRIR